MVDVVETPVAETPTVETPPVDTPPAPVLFGEDGNFTENWTHTLTDKSLHDDPTLKTIKNLEALAGVTVRTKSMVGKNTMEIPNETSSELVWNAYFKAGGKPDTVGDYNLKAPDGFPEEVLEKVFPKARLESWQERFFKAGISKKAADQFIVDFAQDMLADLQTMKQTEEMELTELTNGLSIDWGAAYDQKIHLGNMAIEEGTMGDVEFKARIVAKIQKDPDLTRFTSNLGGKFAEGKPPNFTAVPTPGDFQNQIDKIMENPLYLNGTTEQRMKLANQIMAIREKMKPEVKTTV